ncbi:hypothetical protein ACIG87_28525 [Micromonospora sp. NPDC051925]|uniref:hypothetical protein n=1 Tax=Micromonospora sp. NPDC051925 TaxID=3364288 RepID=UPI0037C606AF
MQTPLWVPLLVAAMGFFGTVAAGVGGVLLTQRHTAHREKVAYERERERERERWARDDQARTFEHRREAYAKFYEELSTLWRKARENAFEGGEPLPNSWGESAFPKLYELSLYASAEVASVAHNSLGKVREVAWISYKGHGSDAFQEGQQRYFELEKRLLNSMRLDLLVSGNAEINPPWEWLLGRRLGE